jgi:hypothetical protein
MARRRGKDAVPPRGFYETTSPFETFAPGSRVPATYKGQVDDNVDVSSRLGNDIPGTKTMSQLQPEQYDNPRGYPGLAIVQTGGEKSKFPLKQTAQHSIAHQIDGSAKLTRTGKP